MSFQDFGPIEYPPNIGNGAIAFNGAAIDATTKKYALVFRAPKTGKIRYVAFRCHLVTVADTVSVRLETVASSNPTGTLAGANGSATVLVDTASVSYRVQLTADVDVVAGTQYAIVIATTNASGNVRITGIQQTVRDGAAYVATYNGSTWTRSTSEAPVMWVEYWDGSAVVRVPVKGTYPYSLTATSVYNNATGPVNEIGNRIILPAPLRSSGCWCMVDMDGDFEVKLYNAAEEIIARTGTVARGRATDGVVLHYLNWILSGVETTVELSADTVYRCLVAPTTTTSIGLQRNSITDSLAPGLWDTMPCGQNVYRSGRYLSGSGTGFSDVTESRMGVGLLLDGIKDWPDFQLVTVQESIVADWTIYRDDDAVFACVAYAADGVTVQNITGCKIRCTLKYNRDEDADAAAVWQGDTSDGEIVITDATNGAFTVTIPESATSAFTRQTLLDYDIRIEDATGKEWTAQIGVLTVKTNVTRTMPA